MSSEARPGKHLGEGRGIDAVSDRSPVGVAGEYLGLTAIVTALAGLILRPWSGGWSVPIVYRNDALSVVAMVDAAGWTGTARGSSRLGAPHGTSWIDFPLGPDRLHLIAVRLLRLVAPDTLAAMNLYWIAGFVLVAVAGYGVLRHLGVSIPVAGALSIAFSFAPYHFMRLGSGHLFLAAYYAVPLGVLLALWSTDGSLDTGGVRQRRWWAALWVLVVGSASAYYAAFAIVVVVALGLVTAVRRGAWRTLVVPAAVAAAIGGVVVLNVAGDLAATWSAGANQEASLRPANDLEQFALTPWALAVPGANYRLGGVGDIAARVDAGLTRGGTAYLGVLALVGLGVIAVRCVRDGRRPGTSDADLCDQWLYRRLGVMTLAGLAVAGVGGGYAALAAVDVTQIRVWNRMSIVLAFVGLIGIGPPVDRWIRRRWGSRSVMGYVVAAAMVLLVVVDQVGALPDRADSDMARRSDAEVARGLEQMLEPGDSVFQFPYSAFPGGVNDTSMPTYSHLGPWAAAEGRLAWSAGAMQGRGGDWQASWAAQEPVLMAEGLAAAGFDALYVDRRAAAAPRVQAVPLSGAETADLLDVELELPTARSRDGSRQWFDLRPLRADMRSELGAARVARIGRAVVRPIGVTFDGAAGYTATMPGTRLLGPDAAVTLRREDDDRRPVEVRFELSGETGAVVDLRWPGGSRSLRMDDGPTEVVIPLELRNVDTTVTFSTDAAQLPSAPRSAPDMRLELTQLTVLDQALARNEGTVRAVE